MALQLCSPKIILVSAFSGPDLEAKAKEANIDHILNKPVKRDMIKSLMREIGFLN